MDTKYAIVSLVGKPNVGKSTLFNELQKNDFAITSNKPQTTRNSISTYIEFANNKKAILIDTPGFHFPNNKLDNFLNSEIKNSIKQSTLIFFIFDASRDFDNEDKKILENISNISDVTKILLINKIDSKKNNLKINLELINQKYQFNKSLEISAKQKLNIDKILTIIEENTIYENVNVNFFKRPSDEFIASEIIRESCIFLLKKELPYAIGVSINTYTYNNENNTLNIDANILIEKESQKPIVVGAKGSMIKKIGIESRKKLLDIYDCKINLKLFVKVKDDWRNNEYDIKSLGYK